MPYLPLADALRGAAQAGAVRDALSSRPALSMLLPEGGGGLTVDSDRSGLARQQMFGGVLGLLTELAAAGPVLLVLEDLHWADASTRDLVTFLSRMLHRERVALIGTYRTDDLHRRHPLRPVVAELLRLPGVIAVDLAPLSPSALAEHLTAAAHGRIGATELNGIVARAEGNAYYAEELLAASVSGDRSEQSLPAGLAALLLSRVEQLSDAAQRVLRAAAVAGRKADDELVQAASGLVSAEYEAAVREAVTHQLLVPDGTEGYVFRHALLREAVYGDLLPGERTRLHGTMSALLSDEHRLAMPGNGRPSWPSTAWPATTSPGRSPPPSGRVRRRSGWARRPRRTGTTIRRSPCGSGWPSRSRRPAWPAASSACCPRPTRRTAATSTGPCTCSGGFGRPSPRPTRGTRR